MGWGVGGPVPTQPGGAGDGRRGQGGRRYPGSGQRRGGRQPPDHRLLEPLSSCRPEPCPVLSVTPPSHGPASARPRRAGAGTTASSCSMGWGGQLSPMAPPPRLTPCSICPLLWGDSLLNRGEMSFAQSGDRALGLCLAGPSRLTCSDEARCRVGAAMWPGARGGLRPPASKESRQPRPERVRSRSPPTGPRAQASPSVLPVETLSRGREGEQGGKGGAPG